jgi:hypothetical protein
MRCERSPGAGALLEMETARQAYQNAEDKRNGKI